MASRGRQHESVFIEKLGRKLPKCIRHRPDSTAADSESERKGWRGGQEEEEGQFFALNAIAMQEKAKRGVPVPS